MIGKIMQKSSAHWYNSDGEPAYEVPSADGKKMVKTTVIQARKLGLLPSVTTVFKILNKEAINAWRIKEMFKAVRDNPQLGGESDESYEQRIVDIADSVSSKARLTGDKIHKYCEFALSGANPRTLECDIPEATKDAIDKFIGSHITNPQSEVLCINNKYRYAGRVDCICNFDGVTAILDFKSQDTKGGDARYYDEMCYQGSAYCLAKDVKRFISVIISSTDHGKLEWKEWTTEEILNGRKTFLLMLALFKRINKVR